MSERLLTLAQALDTAGVPPYEIRPTAFAKESERRVWRGVIAAWGVRMRERAAEVAE